MKIAFDGTVLHGRKSGVGYYCEELLKAMLALNHDDQFCVFSHQPINLHVPSVNGNLTLADSVRFPVRAFYLHALLPRLLNAVQPDLCHYTNFLAPIADERPYVVTIHDMGLEALSDAHPLAKRLYTKNLIPRVARRAKLIITNSEFSKWEIVRYLGIPETHIRVTPLAASPEFEPTGGPPRDKPYFLYVGNLEPRKNLERLIEAFAHLPRRNHDLVIVGNRWYHGEAPQQKARALGLNGSVKFLGYVPRTDLPALFSGATALVYPSLLEGFGLPVVEAMACGTPVITSNNSSMREVASDAALLIDPRDVRSMTEALARIAEDEPLRKELSAKGLKRSAEFSWKKTAGLTMEAYREALNGGGNANTQRNSCRALRDRPCSGSLTEAIRKTLQYASLFQYPLHADELRERLFEVEVDVETFNATLKSIDYQPDPKLVPIRLQREKITAQAIDEVRPHLRTLAWLPFVRMIAFSGSTAHGNMTTTEDLDLFIIVEDGKLWATFLIAMVWAKAKGLRKRLCMNYVISDAGLPLFEHDAFTAQQAASLKPIYGKSIYERFIAANPFVNRWFPNFEPSRHRDLYAEIKPDQSKRWLESCLRLGPIQALERLSRFMLGRYLRRKITSESDVHLDPRRLKLHLYSHKQAVLRSAVSGDEMNR